MQSLSGIRVIDASRVLAGPFCGQMLADNGAEVVKIEPPDGDMNRRFPTVVNGVSTNYLCVNRGKLNCTLNLQHPEGRKLLHELARRADVFIQNFLPDAAAKLGTDYESLKAINPDLIYVTISGYGPDGPLRNRPGYDQMVSAYCGIMSLTGESDGPPLNSGASALDMSAGMLAYGGVVTALFARKSGIVRGQKIDVSLLNAGLNLLSYHALNWTVGQQVDQRLGRENGKLVPHAPFRCRDGDLVIGAGQDAAFRSLCNALAAPELARDPRFVTLSKRIEHTDELRGALEGILARDSVRAWVERLDGAGIPCAPVNTLDVALEEEQVRTNKMVIDSPVRKGGGSMKLLGLPFALSGTPGEPKWAPAQIGEDTENVLREVLGLDADQIVQLRAAKAI